MLQIRPEQVAALAAAGVQEGVHELARTLRPSFAVQHAFLGRDGFLRLVDRAVRDAARHRYVTRRDAAYWTALVLFFGIDFATDPQLPWLRDILDDGSTHPPGERLVRAYGAASKYLDAVAGSDNAALVRMLMRARRATPELFAAAGGSGARRTHLLCAWLWPRKTMRQLDTMPQLTELGVSIAAELRLAGNDAPLVCSAVAFILGSGFAQDPQHAWAREAAAGGTGALLAAVRRTCDFFLREGR